MSIAWQIAQSNFVEDDGSLPGLEFTGLSPDSVRSLVGYFFRCGTLVSENATLYDNSRQEDVPLNQLDDPVGLVLSGATHSFHCCFGGMSIDGVPLPVLGLFVFRDCIEIDYRMGAEWNPNNIDAFFRLLAHLKSMAPEAIVESAQCEGVPYPEQFKAALNCYCEAQQS